LFIRPIAESQHLDTFKYCRRLGRNTKKDRNHFYVIANGFLEEVKYQLLLAKDLRYIGDLHYEELVLQTDEVGKMLSAWIKSQT
jgi:four helix bundle protein